MSSNSFIPLNRKIFNHPFWKEDRPYSRFEAWLWLIAQARFEKTEASELIGGKIVRWNRGELPISLRHLGELWGWSKNKVDNYLNLLISEGMISKRTQAGTSQTIITLLEYGTYNDFDKNKGQQMGQGRDTQGTGPGHGRDNTNNYNNSNNSNKGNNPAQSNLPPMPPQGQGYSVPDPVKTQQPIEQLAAAAGRDMDLIRAAAQRFGVKPEHLPSFAEAFPSYVEAYVIHLRGLKTTHTTEREFHSWFQNWLPKRLNSNNNSNNHTQKGGQDEAAEYIRQRQQLEEKTRKLEGGGGKR